jgi:hypothetical protein
MPCAYDHSHGFSRKTPIALLGSLAALGTTGLLTLLAVWATGLTG